jgi:hypothetical protein
MSDHRPAADEALHRTEKVQALFLVLVCWIWTGALIFRGRLSLLAAILVLAGAFPLAFALTRLVRGASALFAEKLIGGLSSAGGIPYQQGYSVQESLIARGRLDEAVESFRVHLMEFPDDIPGRYRLATLHLRERNDPASAEAEFLSIRRRRHDRSTAMLVANHMVDIYRAGGQRGKLMVELSRMVKEWPGTPMAEGAAKLLEETRRELA